MWADRADVLQAVPHLAAAGDALARNGPPVGVQEGERVLHVVGVARGEEVEVVEAAEFLQERADAGPELDVQGAPALAAAPPLEELALLREFTKWGLVKEGLAICVLSLYCNC